MKTEIFFSENWLKRKSIPSVGFFCEIMATLTVMMRGCHLNKVWCQGLVILPWSFFKSSFLAIRGHYISAFKNALFGKQFEWTQLLFFLGFCHFHDWTECQKLVRSLFYVKASYGIGWARLTFWQVLLGSLIHPVFAICRTGLNVSLRVFSLTIRSYINLIGMAI